jgi:predicted kinase
MQKIWFLRGLPGSGKSTWARNKVLEAPANFIKRVNKDELRKMLDAGRYSKGNEQFILELKNFIILRALDEGKHVIVDDTNFEPKHLEAVEYIIKNLTSAKDVHIEIKDFNIDVTECIKRNELRSESERVPESVIWDMYNRYVKPQEYPTQPHLEQDKSLPPAIICDLDGTLALHRGRSPYDCMQCDTDALNEPVAKILWAKEEKGYQLIFVSGRNGECFEKSRDWLIMNGFRDFILHMREDGDNRKDAIVKKEIFYDLIHPYFYVEYVLDDRNQVVDMWRKEIGLPCFQVNYGDF